MTRRIIPVLAVLGIISTFAGRLAACRRVTEPPDASDYPLIERTDSAVEVLVEFGDTGPATFQTLRHWRRGSSGTQDGVPKLTDCRDDAPAVGSSFDLIVHARAAPSDQRGDEVSHFSARA